MCTPHGEAGRGAKLSPEESCGCAVHRNNSNAAVNTDVFCEFFQKICRGGNFFIEIKIDMLYNILSESIIGY